MTVALHTMPLPSRPGVGSASPVSGGIEVLSSSDPDGTGPAASTLPYDRDAALTLLFSTHYARLLGLARLVCGDRATAEDVVQDAFAALHRKWRTIRDPQAALAYLQRSVVNGGRNQARGQRVRERFLGVRSAEPSSAGPPERAEDSDERARLVRALGALPLRQRQVLVLRYYLDQSESQIATTLGISAGSVKTHASRGLAALGRTMGATTEEVAP